MLTHLLTFSLSSPVAAKKNAFRASITKRGRLYQYLDKGVKAREQSIADEIGEQIEKLGKNPALPVTGPCRVEISIDRRHADVIGASETILDAMQGSVYENDRQALDLRLWHTKALPAGTYAIVRVSTFDPADAPPPLEMP